MKRRAVLFTGLVTLGILACICTIPSLSFPTPTVKSPVTTIAPVVSSSPPAPVDTDAAPFNLNWEDNSPFAAALTTSYQAIPDELTGASRYHLAISLSNPPSSLSGVEEVRYTNQEDSPLEKVEFAIFAEILGGSIQVHDPMVDSQPVDAIHRAGILTVPLAMPLEPGQSVIIHLEFEVSIPTQGGGYYYGIFGYNDDILSLAHFYPTVLVYDQDGWNDTLPDLDGDPLFSDSSFYLVSVDAPADLVLVASGTEIQRSDGASRQRVLYADGPARDFYLAAAPGLVKLSETAGEVTVNSYAPNEDRASAQRALDYAIAGIQEFSQRYVSYPYTEFDVVPIVTGAGGVEFPGMTAVAKNIYRDRKSVV